jgi:hypothetical protein
MRFRYKINSGGMQLGRDALDIVDLEAKMPRAKRYFAGMDHLPQFIVVGFDQAQQRWTGIQPPLRPMVAGGDSLRYGGKCFQSKILGVKSNRSRQGADIDFHEF